MGKKDPVFDGGSGEGSGRSRATEGARELVHRLAWTELCFPTIFCLRSTGCVCRNVLCLKIGGDLLCYGMLHWISMKVLIMHQVIPESNCQSLKKIRNKALSLWAINAFSSCWQLSSPTPCHWVSAQATWWQFSGVLKRQITNSHISTGVWRQVGVDLRGTGSTKIFPTIE